MFDHLARGVYSDTALGNYTRVCTDSINNVTQPLKLTDLSAWSCSFISSSTFLRADQALSSLIRLSLIQVLFIKCESAETWPAIVRVPAQNILCICCIRGHINDTNTLTI